MKSPLAGAALALALAFPAFGSAPVAFVTDIKGSATIAGDAKLNFLAELAPGTRLHLGSGASVAVTFAATGTEYTLVGPGEFVVLPAEVKVEKGVVPAKRTVMQLPDAGVIARISHTATASLRMRGVQPPVDAGKAGLEYPVETRISTVRPMLRWRDDPDAAATVSLVDANGKEVWKGPAKSGSVQPPVKLSPSTRYTWTVMTPKGLVGEAGFETLPADSMAKVGKSSARARTFSDRVLHALLLQDVGALQEARAAWAALARERPDLPELAALAR
jgi:hypothetical protein